MNDVPRLKDNPFLYMFIIKYCINFTYLTTFLLVALSLLTGYLLLTPTIIACCIVAGLIENYSNRIINKHENILNDIMTRYLDE